ncbi:ObirOr5-U12 [Ooceraea biroi]|uniref:Odorant receptor n=2 Tax=Ooceraea biroi TaxID=2015173 RepID=A0A3L8DJJ0_OOCBI|nr:odorant receptor 13a isoform X1 [Ooceraea biroi]RLU20567.1 ObirOr5-U12 [Ooceraea biroi]
MDMSKYPGYKDFVWAIEVNRFGLDLIGLWPTIDKAAKNSYISDLRVSIIFIIIAFASGIPFIWSLIRVRSDIMLVMDNLQVTLTIMAGLLKLIIIRWKQTALLSIIKMMAEDWIAFKLDTQRDVMMKWARTARLIVICGYIVTGFGIIVVIIPPYFGIPFRRLSNLTDSDKPLPLQTYYFYDTDPSPQFELTFLIQAITMFLAAISYTSVDALLGLVILHTCGQLENFKYQLANMIASENFDSALRNSMITHVRLIRFTNKIEDIFALLMLGLVLHFGIVFCLHGFLVVSVMTDDQRSDVSFSRICSVIAGVTVLLAHTFLYCGAGEIMTQHCDAVYHAIYDLEWYKLESRKSRNLILLMIRAGEPFRITAGKVIPLTLTTFCSLLKTSVGYISFLLAKCR